jgi:hypothetical protein
VACVIASSEAICTNARARAELAGDAAISIVAIAPYESAWGDGLTSRKLEDVDELFVRGRGICLALIVSSSRFRYSQSSAPLGTMPLMVNVVITRQSSARINSLIIAHSWMLPSSLRLSRQSIQPRFMNVLTTMATRRSLIIVIIIIIIVTIIAHS